MTNQQGLFFKIVTDRHTRLLISLTAACITFFIGKHILHGVGLMIMTWTLFALTFIVLSWIVIIFYHPGNIAKDADKEDTTGSVIFLVVVAAALCSLAGIFLLLKSIPSSHSKDLNVQVLLAFGSVFSSWVLVHTLFILRYAHLYYAIDKTSSKPGSIKYGLEFPSEKHPDYLDFAYFSFVLGMTFQVSDVQITSRGIRRLALLHGCLSFLYNTIILALSINLISSLISK